ncbi:MAG: glycine cleavage system aminomethyltransferase GcvT [Gammaproteobacteria bacterium]|nr:glycine cleavage system aminomethyltransferase GcvT [Gammaproteobacteria bacterium]
MSDLQLTPLNDLHLELGARMVPFAGYSMPVQYKLGLIGEHAHTRNQAGLFDVSHMGQLHIGGEGRAPAMEKLVPIDVVDLAHGRQRYALLTNDDGGILDDLMITNAGDHLFVVVNAACKAQDIERIETTIGNEIDLRVLTDRALLALQGPAAAGVLAQLAPDCQSMPFMTAQPLDIDGTACYVSRSGYTGEDGYEISLPAADADRIARRLLEFPEVLPIGLGARDTLRLEAGLCLYGQDLDSATTPVEAGLNWALSKARRADGERAGGYPGADIIHRQQSEGPTRKRIGLVAQGRAPVRAGAELVDAGGNSIGTVTSGGYAPTLGAPVAMAYVDAAHAVVDSEINALLRGKPQPMTVTKMPFVPQRYYRG